MLEPPPEGKLGKFANGSIIYISNPLEIGSIIAFSIGAVILLFIKLVKAFVISWGVIEFVKEDIILYLLVVIVEE